MILLGVLVFSAGAEVVELASPAEHITMADHDMVLPGPLYAPEHLFDGQRFVRHEAAKATWVPWRMHGFVVADSGIGAATQGLAGARVVRRNGSVPGVQRSHDTEFCFFFVLAGRLTVRQGQQDYVLSADDSMTIPGNMRYAFDDCSEDLEFLEVTFPAEFPLL
jgi:mannose-6-phosphate isomerase-like protein (cupin superfamily)